MKVAIRVRQRTLQDCIVLDDAVAEDLAVANAAVTAAVDIVFAGRKGDRKMFFGSFWAGPVVRVQLVERVERAPLLDLEVVPRGCSIPDVGAHQRVRQVEPG